MKSLLLYTTQLLKTGGIESHILEFCEHMSSNGIAIDLIVPNFQMKPEEEKRLRNSCNNVYLNIEASSRKRLLWLVKIAYLIRGIKYDALYTNGQGESIYLVTKLVRKPKVWVHHHHTSGDQEDQLTWGKNYFRTLKAADVVIACSSRNAQFIQLALDRQIMSIPCFSRQVCSTEDRLYNKSEKIRFGYYGRLIPEKGIDILCRLSEEAELRDLIEIHIWGEGVSYPPSFFENFPLVKYYGTFRSQDELESIINFLDAFLLFSNHPEGLPICLLEAMSGGLPWLATDRGGVYDILCDHLSTRIVSHTLSYSEIIIEVKTFANDLKAGKVSRKNQIAFYNQKFSAASLINEWSGVLGLEKVSAK